MVTRNGSGQNELGRNTRCMRSLDFRQIRPFEPKVNRSLEKHFSRLRRCTFAWVEAAAPMGSWVVVRS
jgi:hypothetical protein